jgi:hypothetical protein
MMSKMDSKAVDLSLLYNDIDIAFRNVRRPLSSLCKDIQNQDIFESVYLGNELKNTVRHLYDFDPVDVHYLTPFLMTGYLHHYGENYIVNDDWSDYLLWFGHYRDEIGFIKDRYLSTYEKFDARQRICICSFLTFLVKYKMDEGFVEQYVLDYWCGD